jgi:hypothetical protein
MGVTDSVTHLKFDWRKEVRARGEATKFSGWAVNHPIHQKKIIQYHARACFNRELHYITLAGTFGDCT